MLQYLTFDCPRILIDQRALGLCPAAMSKIIMPVATSKPAAIQAIAFNAGMIHEPTTVPDGVLRRRPRDGLLLG